MLAYLSTNDPYVLIGLALVFIGIAVCVPLTDKGGGTGSWAVAGAFLLTWIGMLFASYPAVREGAGPTDPEGLRVLIRILLMVAFGVASFSVVSAIRGYFAGRRGGCRALIRVVTGL